MSAFLADIKNTRLDARTKGIPLVASSVAISDVGAQGWNLLDQDLMYPVLAIREERMHRNLSVMRDFARHHGVSLAPHGKSTVCPQLYVEQMTRGGCWGITAATIQQAAVVAATGVPNIIIANEVVGPANVRALVDLRCQYPLARIVSLVDSAETVQQLVAQSGRRADQQPFEVLLEVGYRGGRTGVRSMDEARAVLDEIARAGAAIRLAGVECYEGTINRQDPTETIAEVDRFLDFALDIYRLCDQAGMLDTSKEVLLTAGGSAYFDRVAQKFRPFSEQSGARVVLRGGSYLTYDHGFYRKKLKDLDARGGLVGPDGARQASVEFLPALELWAAVESLKDPGMAILTMGIRDLPYDLGYPIPLRHYRNGKEVGGVSVSEASAQIVNSNDQHCYMRYDTDVDIRIGDVIVCGISHPCTAFDKWDVVYLVDERFTVTGAVKTFF